MITNYYHLDATIWIAQQFNNLSDEVISSIDNKLTVLLPIAEKYERSFRTSKVLIEEDLILKLENNSSTLWNHTAIVVRSETKEANKKLLIRCKLFAAILLSIQEVLMPSNERKLRTLKCYVNTLKVIMDGEYSEELVTKTQEQADKLIRILEEKKESFLEVNTVELKKLTLEYYLLNFQITLNEGDFEMAKVYNTKANIQHNLDVIEASLLLELCRIIYNACLNLKEKHFEIDEKVAIKDVIEFLKNGYDYINMDIEKLKSHIDYNNVRYSILILLSDYLLKLSLQNEYSTECEEYISILQNEYPKKLEPYLLSINLAKNNSSVSNMDIVIEEIIMKVIISVDVVENFEAILQCINEFSEISTKLANVCLDYILINKLNPELNHPLFEKLITLRIFITTQSKTLSLQDIIDSLKEYCSQVERLITKDISNGGVAAIITLLWNTGKKAEKEGKFQESIDLYNISLNVLFSKNYTDTGKLQRAIINCYINLDSFEKAKRTYESMTETVKDSPITQLMILRILIKEDDTNGSKKCIEKIKLSDSENSLDALILAVSHCKEKTDLTIGAMNMLFEKLEDKHYSEQKLNSTSLPTLSLSRYTIQLILKILESSDNERILAYFSTVEDLLQKSFEYLERIKIKNRLSVPTPGSETDVLSINELEWFASTSYNITAKCVVDSIPINLKNMIKMTRNFIELIPSNDLSFPKMFYFWFWSCKTELLELAILGLNVKQDNSNCISSIAEKTTQFIQGILKRRESDEFKKELTKENIQKIDQIIQDAVTIKFEAVLKTRERHRIMSVVKNTESYYNSNIDICLIDSVVSTSDYPKGIITDVIDVIIERNLGNSQLSTRYMIRWVKLLLSYKLDLELTASIKTIEQLYIRVCSTVFKHDSHDYEESKDIEIISTLCWNQGVNAIMQDEKKLGTSFCKKAVQFAQLVNDSTANQLQNLWSSLAVSADIESSFLS